MSDVNKVFIMLVGLPGTGKSTYCQENKHLIGNCTIVSSDDIMMDIAYKYGFTYNQLFDDVTYSFCEKMMYRIAKLAIERGDNIIWDQTNLTVKSRAKKLDMIPSSYKKICIDFPIPDDWEKRLDRPGKIIPKNVLDMMKKTYDTPSLSEGFDSVVTARN